MTITPDDLPSDAGASQVVCGCLSELFRFVITGTHVHAVCAACGATAGQWATTANLGGSGAAGPAVTRIFDPASALQAGSGWPAEGEPTGPGRADPDITKVFGGPPPLPPFAAAACDACLEGGPYDGQLTFTMGADPFIIRGVGSYRRGAGKRDDRAVYRWAGPAT
jgi:hypothetical protein